MATNVFDGDVVVRGSLIPTTLEVPAASVNSAAIKASANLDADKLQNRSYAAWAQANAAAVTETRTLFVARRTGEVNHVIAGSIAKAIGNSTVTLDVRKNGTTILSSVITLNSSNTDRVAVTGTLSGNGAFVAGDWFEVVITATVGSGTLPTGVFVQMECDQNGV